MRLNGLRGHPVEPVSARTDENSLVYYSADDHAVLERSVGRLTVYRLPKVLAAETIVDVCLAGSNLILNTEAKCYLMDRETGRIWFSNGSGRLHYAGGDGQFLFITSKGVLQARVSNGSMTTSILAVIPHGLATKESYYDPRSEVLLLWDGLQSYVLYRQKWWRANDPLCVDPYNKCLWSVDEGVVGMFERIRCYSFDGKEMRLESGQTYPYTNADVVLSRDVLNKVYLGDSPGKVIHAEMRK